MSAFADLSEIVNRLTGGNSGLPQHHFFWMDSRVQGAAAQAPTSGRGYSLWRMGKSNGANGAIPSTVATPGRATLGALGQADPTGGRQLWLFGMEGGFSQAGNVLLYDRLLHIGGLSGASASAQTVGGTIGRYTSSADCVGNQIWVEIYTAIGSTATTVTASYTNQAGTTGRTTQATAIGGTGLLEAQKIIPLPLQDGDTGVQAVASVTLALSTGTAGNFGVTVARPLLMACNATTYGSGFVRDTLAGLPSMPEIKTDACLAFTFLPSATAIPQGFIALHMAER